MSLLAPLTPDERATFLVVTLTPKSLLKVVGRLGTAPSGIRIDTLSPWDLVWSLVDYYEEDAEVSKEVDRTLRREVGHSQLAAAVAAEGGAKAVTDLLLESRDPARDLAWALLSSDREDTGELASALVKTIIAEFDEADARAQGEQRAQEEPEQQDNEPRGTGPEPPESDRVAREIVREATRAQSGRRRALKRVGTLKERLVELEQGIASARRELRAADEARQRLEAERDLLAEERGALRARLRSGTAAEVARLTDELEAATRRVRALESEAQEARESEASLSARVRTLEETRSIPAAAPTDPGEDEDRAPAGGAVWSLPVFTGEFYESIRRWDRKIVRNAFEKAYRLAEDWRHPSLRAIPLEGLPGRYRIRVATDVRLIYRTLDGGRVEILSLIDREDLQRYIRQAKTR